MPRPREGLGRSINAEQERSPLDALRRDVSVTREAFATYKHHDAVARKAAGSSIPKRKELGGFHSSEQTVYEERLREYRNAVLEASKSETDPKKKAALLREALIDTTVKEADELWSAERRMKAEAKGGSGAWEKISRFANRTVEGYRKLSWKQKLAISGALLVGANTGIPLVMGGAAVGIAAQRVLSAGSAAMGMDALIKRFGIDRSRVNEILGREIRKEKDPTVLAEKLSALLSDENNELNGRMLGIGSRKSKEIALRGAAGAAIFGSVVLGLPGKAIGQGVEHIAGDKIRVARSVAGNVVHKIAGWLHIGGAEASIPPGGNVAMAREGVLATEEKLALEKVRAGIHNRMAFNEGYGQEEQIARMKAQTEKGIKNRMGFNEGAGAEDRIRSERVRAGVRNRMAFNEGYGTPEDQAGIRRSQEILSKTDHLSFKLEKGGSVEGSLNQYLKAHVEEIKARPELQKALGWDGDPKHIGRASHRLWLRMVDDVRAHPHASGHQKLIEQLEKAGFHVKEAMKDTQHPERLTKMFDAAARRMPIGMEFTINPKTGALEFSEPRVGKLAGGMHETADSTGKKIHHGPTGLASSRLQEMLDAQHAQKAVESLRVQQHIDELRQSNQDTFGRASTEIMQAEKAAEIAEQSVQAFKRSDLQLQKIGLFAQERNAWLADKTTHVEDVLRQIPRDYDIGRGGAGIDINLPHQNEYKWGAVVRQIKLAEHLREAMERAHVRFDEAGIPKNSAARDMTIGQFLSKVNPQTGAFENSR